MKASQLARMFRGWTRGKGHKWFTLREWDDYHATFHYKLVCRRCSAYVLLDRWRTQYIRIPWIRPGGHNHRLSRIWHAPVGKRRQFDPKVRTQTDAKIANWAYREVPECDDYAGIITAEDIHQT